MKLCLRTVFYLILAVWFSAAGASSYVDFFKAVERDDGRTVSKLLERGFDPNAVHESGQTALYLALRDGCDAVAEVLLAHPDLKVDVQNAQGETALMMAALKGRLQFVQTLLTRGAAINTPGWTPLHSGAAGQEPRITALLLDRGAVIDARSSNGTTPLMMAARDGAIDGASLLLLRGADARARNDRQLGAADFARMAGRDRLAAQIEAAAGR